MKFNILHATPGTGNTLTAKSLPLGVIVIDNDLIDNINDRNEMSSFEEKILKENKNKYSHPIKVEIAR